jgi:carboxypeptidase PM20D1
MGPTARIARAILRLERSPLPACTPAPTVELLRRMAPHASLALRPLMANAARLGPVLTRALIAAGPEPAAMTRTTVAVTTLSGSPALNVIASTAKAGLNIRIMVGDTVAGVIEHVRKAVADDQVHIDVVDQNEPSPISPIDDDAFRLLESTITELFPDAVPAPYVMMAATDSRFFTEICERVYRFAPFRMTKAQRESIHAYDEHLGVDAFIEGVGWYQRLIERIPR